MNDKALSEILQMLSKNRQEDEDSDDESVVDTMCYDGKNDHGRVQTFPDHIQLAKRFQKTLYCGDLQQSPYHPHFALTDVTLELFNQAVPNSGRLDILDMDYATTVSKAVCIPPCSMILAMMYLEQLRHKNPDYLDNVSPCDLFVVSMLIASKYLFDDGEEFTYNRDWADAVNMDVHDLNALEYEFLSAINWEVFIEPSKYFEFLSKVEQRIASKESSYRGWLSYTDISVLSQHAVICRVSLCFSKIFVKAVLLVTAGYVASVVILYFASVTVHVYLMSVACLIHQSLSAELIRGHLLPAFLYQSCSDSANYKLTTVLKEKQLPYMLLDNNHPLHEEPTVVLYNNSTSYSINSIGHICATKNDACYSFIQNHFQKLNFDIDKSLLCYVIARMNVQKYQVSYYGYFFNLLLEKHKLSACSNLEHMHSTVIWPKCSFLSLKA